MIDYPDILFENIAFFIDKFKGEIELEWGIEALVDEYGKKEIVERFKAIGTKLSQVQKEAVNMAFKEIGYGDIFKLVKKAGKVTELMNVWNRGFDLSILQLEYG